MASHQHLIGSYSDTGDTRLVAVGYFEAFKTSPKFKEKVFGINGTPKLLLAIPAIRHLGLIHDLPGTYTIKAIELKRKRQ